MENQHNIMCEDYDIYEDEHGFLNISYKKILTTDEEVVAQTGKLRDDLLAFFANEPDKHFKIVLDISVTGDRTTHFPNKAREIYKQLSKHRQVKAVAVVSKNKVVPSVLKLIINLIFTNTAFDFFQSRDDAIEWLEKVQ